MENGLAHDLQAPLTEGGSPRVSSATDETATSPRGLSGSKDKKSSRPMAMHGGGALAAGMDVHHWQGVASGGWGGSRSQVDADAKSIASSLAVHDNESLRGEPAAMDTVEDDQKEREAVESESDDGRYDDGMEEIRLNEEEEEQEQAREGLEAVNLGSERSLGDSAQPGLSKQASVMSDVGDAAVRQQDSRSQSWVRRMSLDSAAGPVDSQPASSPKPGSEGIGGQGEQHLAVGEEEGWQGSSKASENACPAELGSAVATAGVEEAFKTETTAGISEHSKGQAARVESGPADDQRLVTGLVMGVADEHGAANEAVSIRADEPSATMSMETEEAEAGEEDPAAEPATLPAAAADAAVEHAAEPATLPATAADAAVEHAAEPATLPAAAPDAAVEHAAEPATLPAAPVAAAGLAGQGSEDDLAVWTTDANGMPQEAASLAPELLRNPPAQAAAAAGMSSFAVENGGSGSAPGTSGPIVRPIFPPEWEETFKGLLYMDGVDALGRPVVVVDADAVPKNMRSSALLYVKGCMEPVVTAGHYVLVFTARQASLPSLWLMGAYRSLPRPFRKNVQYIILVRPGPFLRAVLAFMRPFVSHKAHRKIIKVETLAELSEATGGEVTVQHLGSAWMAAAATGGDAGTP